MKYEEVKVKSYLADFVKCFWTSETSTQSVAHTILPDGYFDLVIEIRDGQIVTTKLTGIWTAPVDIKTAAHTKIMAVRFKPLATELLENINLRALLNSSIILPDSFSGLGTLSVNSFTDFCQQIENYLNHQLEQAKPVCSRKILLFQEIFNRKTFNVQKLADKSNMTSRQINRYFNAAYGLSLKTYLNIVRCRSTYRSIANNELYPKNDYFDQAHYIKEIKKYTGVTPSALSRNKNDRFLQLSTLKAS